MDRHSKYRVNIVALLIILGSATLLMSCKSKTQLAPVSSETLLTQESDSLTIILSENGLKKNRFKTPLMERYELAREPYMEFRKGVYVETYRDSTEQIESTLIADYAIYYEKRNLWEARGNVIATGEDRTLYTEQLFWDEKTERIYSNVDSKVVQGDDIFIGDGFESDDKFENWTFRNYIGHLTMDVSPNEHAADSTRNDAADNAEKIEPSQTTPPPARPEPVRRPEERGERDARLFEHDANIIKPVEIKKAD